jgi:signal transduction histidine kinase
VADLQDYSRPIKPEFTEINLSDLIEHVLQPIALPENLKLSIETDKSLTFNSDPTLLRRILSNLIINASQAMPKGGKLRISGFEEENKIQIAVEDTGVGIPDDFKTKIFNPMVTTKAKGQGFGLAVVKRLVEALNGTVSFESQEGKGTKFIIKFRKL